MRRLSANELLPGRLTAYGPDPDQVWEEYGDPAARSIVLVHGGYFRPTVDRGHLRPMAHALTAEGWRVVLAEYRRIPGQPWASVEDLDQLAARVGPGVWVGHSAGGALVMRRGGPVVALAPVGDFDRSYQGGHGGHAVREWIGGTPRERPQDWEALDPSRIKRSSELTILHGTADEAVPLEVNADLPVEWIDGAHHFDLIDPASPHWTRVSRAIAARG